MTDSLPDPTVSLKPLIERADALRDRATKASVRAGELRQQASQLLEAAGQRQAGLPELLVIVRSLRQRLDSRLRAVLPRARKSKSSWWPPLGRWRRD
jgi:hypothetical protein